MAAGVHTGPVVASLYSHSRSSPATPTGVSQSSRSAPVSSAVPPGSSSSSSSSAQPSPHKPQQRAHPFSSISLSPDANYAVASGKDVLHVLRLGGLSPAGNTNKRSVNRLEEIRSSRISQHFQSPIQTSGAPTQNQQYPHLRDALRLPGGVSAGSASPLPAPGTVGGGGGGININVTDVAWSLPQSYLVDNGNTNTTGSMENNNGNSPRQPGARGGGAEGGVGVVASTVSSTTTTTANLRGSDLGLGDSYEELLASPGDDNEYHFQDQHYPSFIKRVYVGNSGEHQRQQHAFESTIPTNAFDDSSVVAAAGSNGVVVSWSAPSLVANMACPSSNNAGGSGRPGIGLFHTRKSNVATSQVSAAAASIGQPEAAFMAHSRAVNRLAWHPTGRRPYLLLSASQDGTAKLWDRRASTPSSSSISGGADGNLGSTASSSSAQPSSFNLNNAKNWFGFASPHSVQSAQLPASIALSRTAMWHCVSTYQPKCEAVRDIKWNPFIDDVFAMVAGEWLCVYDIRIPNKHMLKELTHAGDATSVDWHPTRKYVLATGGGRDRSVKVWDLLNIRDMDDSSTNLRANSGSFRSENSETMSTTSHTSSDGLGASASGRNNQHSSQYTSNQSTVGSQSTAGSISPVKRIASGNGLSSTRHNKKKQPLHVLNIAAPVTRIQWRPVEDTNDTQSNQHGSMIAVATSSIYGANAGGNGAVGLWSFHRPFMPISVCEGHKDGAVVDFAWADRPMNTLKAQRNDSFPYPIETVGQKGGTSVPTNLRYPKDKFGDISIDSKLFQKQDKEAKISGNHESAREWNTILTVGRDGQCLLQDFSHGDRPILDVPKATFALANLSPFQPNFGSLQVMSVHQHVDAPDLKEKENSRPPDLSKSELVFSVTDQGDARDLSKSSLPSTVDVAPELTHLSRFSELYLTSPSTDFPTKALVCRHNAKVAEGLNRKVLTQMWKTIATILEGSGLDGIPTSSSGAHANPIAFVLTPTIENLLLQRADAGDVQTCVVLCEAMDVIIPPAAAGGQAKSRIPSISIICIREWYLNYIDLLQQMCLFTQAARLIRNCRDPVVGALNQLSTTIHESCPKCGKPLQGGTAIQDNSGASPRLSAQRVCRSCRSKVGMCFLCHEPVKGLFVWCPGCGHGGHLEHALEWFGQNEVCPTGCGHKCNLFPELRGHKR